MSTKLDWLRSRVDPSSMRGLEVGALANPWVAPSSGPIRYADYLDTDTLRKNYADDPNVVTGELVEVDFVSGEGLLSDAARGETFEYVCASHVFEHLCNPLRWLRDAEKLLDPGEPGGRLLLAIPDMRFTFDADRPLSTAGDWLLADQLEVRKPTVKMVHDCHARMRHVSAREAWDRAGAGVGDLVNEPSHVRKLVDEVEAGEYVDSHCMVYTPTSFLDILDALVDLDRLGLAFDVFPTRAYSIEFYVEGTVAQGDVHAAQRTAIAESRRRVDAAPGPGPLAKARYAAYQASERAREVATHAFPFMKR